MTQVNVGQEQQVVDVLYSDLSQYDWFFIPDGGTHPTGLYIKAGPSTAFEVSSSATEAFQGTDIVTPIVKVDITYFIEAP